jgi:hypothetical protein
MSLRNLTRLALVGTTVGDTVGAAVGTLVVAVQFVLLKERGASSSSVVDPSENLNLPVLRGGPQEHTQTDRTVHFGADSPRCSTVSLFSMSASVS